MKRLPLGVQNFQKIIEGNYVYADKTEYVYKLLNGPEYVFLSRPRRFGKSLLLDTVAEALLGNKELFKGLWIYDSDYGFKKHPVIRLDMSRVANKTPEILEKDLLEKVSQYYSAEGFELTTDIASSAFANLIMRLHDKYGARVAVLIDEYDTPILDRLTTPDVAEENRKVIKGFYGVLKSLDRHLRFTMITGVSKFGKTSLFSELNNLADITMYESFANICGIPVEDLDKHFGEHIEQLRQLRAFEGFNNLHNEILAWYDGYSWDGETRVINPFSLICFFQKKAFGSFWYSSGTPAFLIDIIKDKPESFLTLRDLVLDESLMDTIDIRDLSLEPLMFQTGYLTVKEVEYIMAYPTYRVEIPNREVREAFNRQVLASLMRNSETTVHSHHYKLRAALASGDLDSVLPILRSLYAAIPYNLHVKLEAFYHAIFLNTFTILGFDILGEVSTSYGIADAMLETGDNVYVFEFKYAECPEGVSEEDKRKLFDKALTKGMEQIKDKGYHHKYQGSGKKVHLAAFAFLGRDEIEMRRNSEVTR